MNFTETPLQGAYVIELQRQADDRGFFARSFCRAEFEAHGLNPEVIQCNVSYNKARGTLRGMHYQISPHQEAKVVRCTRGKVFDVIVDLRDSSPTRHQWFGLELDAEQRNALYVPEEFAHGFLTLTSDSEMLYQMSTNYEPTTARGLRYNDPLLGIVWPFPPVAISERDATHALLAESRGRSDSGEAR